MSKFTFQVDCYSGHYHIPSVIQQGNMIPSFPIAPPSTIYGFLYSLMGEFNPSGKIEFAYGWAKNPPTSYTEGRTIHAFMHNRKFGREVNGTRFSKYQRYLNPSYIISVRGDFVERVRDAVVVGVPRQGVLYLGTSDDAVNQITVLDESSTTRYWVTPAVPGSASLGGLTIRTPRKQFKNYGKLEAEYGQFTFGDQQHYFTMEASK